MHHKKCRQENYDKTKKKKKKQKQQIIILKKSKYLFKTLWPHKKNKKNLCKKFTTTKMTLFIKKNKQLNAVLQFECAKKNF